MRTIKRLVKRAIASPMGWPLASLVLRPRGVTVLMYHRVTCSDSPFLGLDVALFREQMHWLRRHCTLIRPEELLTQSKETGWRRPPVLITFDDGYRDYYQNVFPILQELEIPSIVFIATDFMDNGGLIWTEALFWAATVSGRRVTLPWDNCDSFDLSSPGQRHPFAEKAKLHLKQVPDAERKQELARLFTELGVEPDRSSVERQMMTWEEVRTITRGVTRIGGHSHTHPILSQLEAPQMEDEIRFCRERIESQTGIRPKYFAYPNGRQQDFNDLTKRLLRRHGFELGFSTIPGVNGSEMDDMAIRRQPSGATSTADFACLVAGAMKTGPVL